MRYSLGLILIECDPSQDFDYVMDDGWLPFGFTDIFYMKRAPIEVEGKKLVIIGLKSCRLIKTTNLSRCYSRGTLLKDSITRYLKDTEIGLDIEGTKKKSRRSPPAPSRMVTRSKTKKMKLGLK
jgi:hypothetical protein